MADEPKWTKGPWRVSKVGMTNEGGRPVVTDEKRVAVVDCQTEVNRRDAWQSECEEREANATLISVAPNLYEALLNLLAVYRTMNTEKTAEEIIAEYALAKARGEA